MNQKKKSHLSGKGNFPDPEEKLLCAMRMPEPVAACTRMRLHGGVERHGTP